jgi:Uncharacterised nucleotidyltransferase
MERIGMKHAHVLGWVMAEPSRATALNTDLWTSLLTMAQAERMLGSLAHRLDRVLVPESVAKVLDRAKKATDSERTQAVWEAEMCRRALAPLDVPVILLKGTAFVVAGYSAGLGRQIGDLDILVPRARLDDVETAILAAGWEWVKPDPYDDRYYRDYMHELPPMIHAERDRMIDIHHTILPPTARPTPNAAALIAHAVPLGNGLSILSPADMVMHGVAHLFADGDLAGGMRNLWDIDRLIREFSITKSFWGDLGDSARRHGLGPHLARALRLCHHIYETPVDATLAGSGRIGDIFYASRLRARNGWGQETRKLLRHAFYVRSHWIRMPPLMLARHLWTKWRKGQPIAND